MRYYFNSSKFAGMKKPGKTKHYWGYGESELSYNPGGTVKWYNYFVKQSTSSWNEQSYDIIQWFHSGYWVGQKVHSVLFSVRFYGKTWTKFWPAQSICLYVFTQEYWLKFIAALFIMAKSENNSIAYQLVDWQLKYNHTTDYCSEIVIFWYILQHR